VESSGKGEDLKSLQKLRKPTLDILPGIPGQSTAIFVGGGNSHAALTVSLDSGFTVQTWAEAFRVKTQGADPDARVC